VNFTDGFMEEKTDFWFLINKHIFALY